MRNYAYGDSSLKHLSTVSQELQAVAHDAMKLANSRKLHCPDFGISSGRRTASEQNALYQRGRTTPGNIITHNDGYIKISDHQDGDAVDFFAYIDGRANYEPGNLALIATCFAESASRRQDLMVFEWGGNFTTIADGAHITCF